MTRMETLYTEASTKARKMGAAGHGFAHCELASVQVLSQNRSGRITFTQKWYDADGNVITKAQAAALLG